MAYVFPMQYQLTKILYIYNISHVRIGRGPLKSRWANSNIQARFKQLLLSYLLLTIGHTLTHVQDKNQSGWRPLNEWTQKDVNEMAAMTTAIYHCFKIYTTAKYCSYLSFISAPSFLSSPPSSFLSFLPYFLSSFFFFSLILFSGSHSFI